VVSFQFKRKRRGDFAKRFVGVDLVCGERGTQDHGAKPVPGAPGREIRKGRKSKFEILTQDPGTDSVPGATGLRFTIQSFGEETEGIEKRGNNRSLHYAARRATLRRGREDRAASVGMTNLEKANPGPR
jgi:hypothetical protein